MKITCREASTLLSARMDAGLGVRERLALWLHLRICEACRRVARQLAFLRRAMVVHLASGRPGSETGTRKDQP